MKKRIISLIIIVISIISIVGDAISNANGKLLATGSPGEIAGGCAQTGCHNSGASSNNTGGGSIAIKSTPVMNNNTYVPGQLYHMNVKIAQTGVSKFGINFEAINASGNTNLTVNDNAGTFTITDAVHTAVNHPINRARLGIEHISPLTTADSAVFIFDWTAPNAGTVNLYAAGVAANGDNLSDAADKTYTQHLTLTSGPAGIESPEFYKIPASVYPNPVSNILNCTYALNSTGNVFISLLDLNGRTIKVLLNEQRSIGEHSETFNISDIEATGIYYMNITSNQHSSFQKIFKSN